MSTRTTTSAASIEAALLARLGLGRSASAQEVEAAHDGLIEFLETAPPDLASWTRAQVAGIDEAYALLSDPTIDRSALASATTAAVTAPLEGPAASKGARAVALPPAATGNRSIRRLALGAAALVGIVAIVVAGYNMNGGTGVPPMNGSPAPEAAASPAVDQAVVGELMKKIQANPKDVTSLQSLADAYYQASDFATSATFLQKILDIEPKNITALLALGAAQYNQGDADSAKKQWEAVVAVDDQNIDAHYYLGFMYLTQTPADMVNAKAEWAKVIAIDPNSDIAKNVAQHLNSLASPDPAASGAPAASTAPAASRAPAGRAAPAASPAATPAGD